MAIAVGATRQTLANTYTGLGGWVSYHTGDPGTTGANEATGGTPAYARKQTTFATGANGVKPGSIITFDLPAGTYAFVGLWSAATGGTFIDKAAVSSVTLGAQGQIDFAPNFAQV